MELRRAYRETINVEMMRFASRTNQYAMAAAHEDRSSRPKEMLRMMDFLGDMGILDQMEMRQNVHHLERLVINAAPQNGSPPKRVAR